MVKKILLFLLILIIIQTRGYTFSARNEVHKYGFSALGDDISGLYYNPATLFNLSKALSEFTISGSKSFTYNSLYLGTYLTRLPLFSRYYWTSINLGVGLDRTDNNKNYYISIGGTLYRFIKYGFSYKAVVISDMVNDDKSFSDFDTGFLFRIFFWFDVGISIKNLKNDSTTPTTVIPGLSLKITDDVKFTTGAPFNNEFSASDDYSLALDINVIRGFYLLGGIQEKEIVFGTGYNFNYSLENLYISFAYDTERKKAGQAILSYNHKFHNIFYSSKQEKAHDKADEDEEIVRNKKDIVTDQKFYLNRAKFYYDQQRIEDSKKMLEKVISLDINSKYGKEADTMLKKIKKIEKKIRRNK
ncbi:MAG: hypothetical protein KKH98_04550 [Spirochaetes bacterium]|nr:hypothetical protein [Spirochaetota bacterium]